ncbi:MAG: phosphate ABC transporter substrate-binding protein [Elusimicrobia bacterium CG08_land_8_20_14_0_20_51_18]|nr:MAG: phosphate ABC transporter substrate-binding protein [Elusimicrobia bacterium CG08_land_8_20_14_0_20_51_18]
MKKIILSAVCSALLAPAAYAGKVVMEGSTTILPIAQKAAEVYMNKTPGSNITVRGGGSGVGISSIIDGTCDIANASRAIKQKELDNAVKKGRELKAHIIAMDGIVVVLHPSNEIQELSKEQVKNIFTGKTKNWKDVGGKDLKIVPVSRDSSSGTFEAFMEYALDKKRVRPDALVQASNQGIVNFVAQTPGAIGYIGIGYLSEKVKAVRYNGAEATKENVLKNKYSLARPLFMYTVPNPKGEVKAFLDFLKSPEGQKLVEEEGFIALKKN